MDLLAIHNDAQLIEARRAAIRAEILQASRCIKEANFTRLCIDDIERLFDLYDEHFFGGYLRNELKAKTAFPLRFRLSSTMTRTGGSTTRYRRRTRGGEANEFEIAIASRLLFMSFAGDGANVSSRAVVVCGLACSDRLAALQHIMEHEIIHLAEMLVWDESTCCGPRFRKLARHIFGHTDRHHALVTPREHAAVAHGLKVGSMVGFVFEGRRLTGRINRIHRRATVLVETPEGQPYSDGKSYQKFYVPLERLSPAGS